MSTMPDHKRGAFTPRRPLVPPHAEPRRGRLASGLLAACGLALAWSALGCGGGTDTGEAGAETAGLRVEEEFWDEAKTVRRSRSTTRYGKPVGDYEEFHPNGMPALTGRYSDDGLKEGEWKQAYPSGLEQRRENYVDGELSGEVLEWYPDGSLKSRSYYEAGTPVGEWTSYHEGTDAAVMEQKTFEDGVAVGAMKVFYPTGELRAEATYVDGKLEGPERFYYRNGEVERELTRVGGVPHGLETQYHEGGMKLSEEYWVNGAKSGEWKSWWPNGTLGLVGRREAGLPVGLWQQWHPNGNPRLFGTYVEGKPSGEWRSWYEDGALERVATFDESGEATGPFLEWWPDGSRKRWGTAAGGTPQAVQFTGTLFVWDEQGALDLELSGRYDDGPRVGPLTEEDVAEAEALAADPDQPPARDWGSGASNDENG